MFVIGYNLESLWLLLLIWWGEGGCGEQLPASSSPRLSSFQFIGLDGVIVAIVVIIIVIAVGILADFFGCGCCVGA